MTGRTKEETNGVTLLGNQHTQYPNDYDPKVLETFARLPDSRTLRPSIFPMCRMKSWWKVSR